MMVTPPHRDQNHRNGGENEKNGLPVSPIASTDSDRPLPELSITSPSSPTASSGNPPTLERYLQTLLEIDRHLLASRDIPQCYQILALLGQISEASRVYVIQLGWKPGCYCGVKRVAEWSATGLTNLPEQPEQQFTFEELPWIEPLQQGYIAGTVTALPLLAHFPQSTDTGDILILPIVTVGVLGGAIGFERHETNHNWTTVEIGLLQHAATALSLKLEGLQVQAQQAQRTQQAQQAQVATSSQLFHQTQQLNQQLEALAQQRTQQLQKALEFEALLKRITDRVRDSLDEYQILQTVVRELGLGLQTQSCDTGLYDLEQGTSTISHEFIQADHLPIAQGKVALLSEHTEIYTQLLQGQPVQFCWIQPPLHPVRKLSKRYVALACPVIDDQGVIGDLWLYNAAESCFDPSSVRLVQQVANQCAIAIRQARLYQKAQRQVQELARLNYLKDDFLNTVSHELRSPLANMEMAIQMLELIWFAEGRDLHDPQLPPITSLSSADVQKGWRYFRMLQDECQRETSLVNDLLDLSRLEAGTEPLIPTTIDLYAWIPHIVEPFLQRTQTQQQRLEVQLAPCLPPLTTDLSSLERVLTELLHNACKYTPATQQIVVSAYATSEFLYLQISNSGIEIPGAELPHIFDKFYRIPSHDPWKHGGTGLGLALVKKRIEHLDATIQVQSYDNWVHFTIAFPLADGSSQPNESRQTSQRANE